jgi:hypothetical protein
LLESFFSCPPHIFVYFCYSFRSIIIAER